MSKQTKIEINVTLDDNNVPELIKWNATDGGGNGECKAFILSVWDKDDDNAMRIDLWDKEMSIYDMQRFFHQTLLTMSDTYNRATGQGDISQEIKAFATEFAKKTGILG